MKEMLFTSNIDDEKRLYEIIAELKSRLQVSISSAERGFDKSHDLFFQGGCLQRYDHIL